METTWIFRPSQLHREKYVEATWIFLPAKLHRKKYVEATWIFRPRNYIEKCTWKPRGFFDHRNYIEKVRWNDVEIRQNLAFDVSTWIWRGVPVGCGRLIEFLRRMLLDSPFKQTRTNIRTLLEPVWHTFMLLRSFTFHYQMYHVSEKFDMNTYFLSFLIFNRTIPVQYSFRSVNYDSELEICFIHAVN